MQVVDSDGKVIKFKRGDILLKYHDNSPTNIGIFAAQKLQSFPTAKKKSALTHVAMYVGEGKMAEQTSSGLSYNLICVSNSVGEHRHGYTVAEQDEQGFGPKLASFDYEIWKCKIERLRKQAAQVARDFIQAGVANKPFGGYAYGKGFTAFFRTASRHGRKAPHMTHALNKNNDTVHFDTNRPFICSSFIVAVYQLAGQMLNNPVLFPPFPRVRQSCLPGRLRAIIDKDKINFSRVGKANLQVTHF